MDKICPYACNITTAMQWTYDYDEDGKQRVAGCVERQTRQYIKCAEEQCGAYNIEAKECRYYGK